ncbi:MAG: hypothetical protein OHK0013_12440 [Sandaracinaceae bacterium]
MIYVYIFALIVGGLLLGASLLLGAHADHDATGDAPAAEAPAAPDAAADAGGHDGAASAGGGPQGVESFLVWFVSVRFWTFFLAFFGLTGVLLDGFGIVENAFVAGVLAVGMGLFAGLFATWIVRLMTAESSNSAVMASDYIGKSGRLLVGFGPGAVGKVRVEVKGSTVDLLCVAMDDGTYEAKDEVLIVEMDGPRAKVARTRISTP